MYEKLLSGLKEKMHCKQKKFKEVKKKFKGQFECLRENTEKYINFSVPIKKELDNGKSVTCKIKFIGSFRFMSSSLSNLVDYFSE